MAARHTTTLQAVLVDDQFDGDVRTREPLARHTTYRIGGPARFFVTPFSFSALVQVVNACVSDAIDWIVLGKGSNVLVADEGFDGVVVVLGEGFKEYRFDAEAQCLIAGAGASLSAVVQEAFSRELAGLEFAVGTPGTIGGALRMNAGTKDDWLGSRVKTVTTYLPGKGLKRYAGNEIEWRYRSSSLPPDEIVLECELMVEPAKGAYIRGKMEGMLAKRRKSQPLNMPSCGSVFKNPPGASAGALIDQVGLKGRQVGGAQISPVHANFIVNMGDASAQDVRDLMALAQFKVKEAYGIELQPEVRFLGFE